MKKHFLLIAACAVALALAPASALAEGLSLAVESGVSVTAGQTATVDVVVSGVPEAGIAGMQFSLSAPKGSGILITDLVAGEAITDGVFVGTEGGSSTTAIAALAGSGVSVAEDGVACTATVSIPAETDGGTYGLSLLLTEIYGEDLIDYACEVINGSVVVAPVAARIGETLYASLDEAILAAEAADEAEPVLIELLHDATFTGAQTTRSLTLDLGGHVMIASAAWTITSGEVIIQNGTVQTSVTDVFDVSNAGTVLTLGEKLTVASTSSVVYVQESAELRIAGAAVSTTGTYIPLYADGGSSILMTAGSVTASSTAAISADSATVNISGGTVSGASPAALSVYGSASAAFVSGESTTISGTGALLAADGASASVSGGTLNGFVSAGWQGREGSVSLAGCTVNGDVRSSAGVVLISAGTVNGTLAVSIDFGGYISITGGAFADDSGNTVATLPENHVLAQTSDEDEYYRLAHGCMVTFDVNGGEGTFEPQALLSGRKAVRPAEDPTSEGLVFAGWFLGKELYDFTQPVEEDLVLVAIWHHGAVSPEAQTGLVYTGEALIGVEAGEGFTLEGETAVDAGTHVATATLADGYSWMDGSSEPLAIEYVIEPRDASEAVVADIAAQPFDPDGVEPALAVMLDEVLLVCGTDYTVEFTDNAALGEASFAITFTGNYTGAANGTFEIVPRDASAAKASAPLQTYTGEPIEPSMTVRLDGITLVEGVDFAVSGYENNVQVGTATCTVTFMGNYTGTITGTFAIGGAVELDVSGMENLGGSVYVNGNAFPLTVDAETGIGIAQVSTSAPTLLVAYSWNAVDGDIQAQYPTHMYVWELTVDEETQAISASRLPLLDDLMQYAGTSIRLTSSTAVRIITTVPTALKSALAGSGLDFLGSTWTLSEYGTTVAFEGKLDGVSLTLETEWGHGRAYSKERNLDAVFSTGDGVIRFTNALYPFTMDQVGDILSIRAYMTLVNEEGDTITLYGGTIHRSIGYVAYLNRNRIDPGTYPDAYAKVWEIIHAAYGDIYDEDYQG